MPQDLISALDVYRDDILKQAEMICRDELVEEPTGPAMLHLRGLLAQKAGMHEIAFACFSRAIDEDKSEARYWADYAQALQRRSKGEEALTAALNTLVLAPDAPDAFRGIGKILQAQGKKAEAFAAWEEALRLEPRHIATIIEVGNQLRDQKKMDEALDYHERALMLDISNPDAYNAVAQTRLAREEWAEAEKICKVGLDWLYMNAHGGDERCGDLWDGVAMALFRANRWRESVDAYRKSLNIKPRVLKTLKNYLMVLELLGERKETVGVWVALGVVLEMYGALHEALASFEQAVARKSDCLKALIELGRIHLWLGEPQRAIVRLRRALEVDPEHPLAHTEYGRAMHMVGEYDAGWDEFTWLCDKFSPQWRPNENPVWDGSSLEGHTVMLWSRGDQELGDTIQYLRYAKSAKQQGGKVIVECPAPMVPLLKGKRGLKGKVMDIDYVVAQRTPLPGFDRHAPIASVPVVIKSVRWPPPAEVPYLHVEEDLLQDWKDMLDELDAPDELEGVDEVSQAGEAGEAGQTGNVGEAVDAGDATPSETPAAAAGASPSPAEAAKVAGNGKGKAEPVERPEQATQATGAKPEWAEGKEREQELEAYLESIGLGPEKKVRRFARIPRSGPDPEVPEMKIGISWVGDETDADGRFRFFSLETLAPLGSISGIRLFCLQTGPELDELLGAPQELPLINMLEEGTELVDVAALIHHMDLVITVDNKIAHLAGALARPVWTLLSYGSDWRWLMDREDSPWYPTMRLFRQNKIGDWAELMERVKVAIEAARDTRQAAWVSGSTASGVPATVVSERAIP